MWSSDTPRHIPLNLILHSWSENCILPIKEAIKTDIAIKCILMKTSLALVYKWFSISPWTLKQTTLYIQSLSFCHLLANSLYKSDVILGQNITHMCIENSQINTLNHCYQRKFRRNSTTIKRKLIIQYLLKIYRNYTMYIKSIWTSS